MHSTNNLDDGYLGSGKRLRYSVNKYGKESHIKEILEYHESREELAKREREIVNKEFIQDYYCMNLIEGGEGGRGFTSEEQKLNAIKSNEKQKVLRETDADWVKKRNEKWVRSIKKLYDSGILERKYFYDWTNKTHSVETKQLMSEKAKERVGEKNSQYGTCWITKDGLNKKIKKEEITQWTSEGWIKGRK